MHMWGKLEFKVQQTDNTTLSRFIITIRYRIPTTRQSSQAGINIVGDETNKHHQQHPQGKNRSGKLVVCRSASEIHKKT